MHHHRDGGARRASPAAALGLALTILGVIAGCGDMDAAGAVNGRRAALTQAVPDEGDAAVVAIIFGEHAACTGVLVANGVVLTAAHCLAAHATPPRVLFGLDASAPLAIVDVADSYVHAGFSPLSRADDIAGLLLAGDAPAGISPVVLPTRTAAPGVAVGTSVRLVGFGHDSDVAVAAAPHVKRQGMASVVGLAEEGITLTPAPTQACVGDSGGPVLANVAGGEVLAGLVLGGVTSCVDSATALRVDAYVDSFINPVIAAASGSPPRQSGVRADGCAVSGRTDSSSWLAAALVALALCLTRMRRRPCVGPTALVPRPSSIGAVMPITSRSL